MKIGDIDSIAVGQEVNVCGKVVKVNDVSSVKKKDGKELKKQDTIIGDHKGACRLVLWESDVNKLEEGKSYKVSHVLVREYGTVKYLSFASKSVCVLTDDVGDVIEDADEDLDGGLEIKGEIVAVISSSEYNSCRFCHSKVEMEGGTIVKCIKCHSVMKVAGCASMKCAKFVVKEEKSGREITLSAFEPVLSRIFDGVTGESLAMKLLQAPIKIWRYNERKIVFSVKDICD